jgi:SAM-dependent methyltransferase
MSDEAESRASRESFYRGSHARFASTYRLRGINRGGWGDEAQQYHAYSALLEEIRDDGTLLDLGCGDGMLLRHLIAHSSFQHVPYGMDFLEESIEQARACILPEFADNFLVGNVALLELPLPAFKYIFSCPDHVTPEERSGYVSKLTGRLEPGGRLVLYEYAGSTAFRSFENRMAEMVTGRFTFRSSSWVKIVTVGRSTVGSPGPPRRRQIFL